MQTGRASGTPEAPTPRRLGIGLFVNDEGGYTTVAVAVALLVSVSLVFCAASAEWLGARAADTQVVADATAMAGSDVVASYWTIANVLDACVLSLGLVGVLVLGAGLVVSAIPTLGEVGVKVIDVGRKILDARQRFAKSAAEGLEKIEGTLPLLIVCNSAATVSANSDGSIGYVGCALPFPGESHSDFSSLHDDVTGEDVDEESDALRDATEKAREAKERADAAREEGWMADCGDSPYSLYERAATLSGLAGSENPFYPSPETWTFGVPLERARAYYRQRIATETPESAGIEALTDSCARQVYYDFALERVDAGHYVESDDGSVDIDLPSLPRNTEEVRQTRLYTDAVWPCTSEGGGATLHSTLSCPGAAGPAAGMASLAQVDSGAVLRCPVCGMDVVDMGKVGAASTSIDNGFEHHWRRVVDASLRYQQARNEEAEAEREARDAAEDASDAFDAAIDALAVPRPKLCPPGAWGCVAVVARPSGTIVPSELTSAFLSGQELPAGAAVSAATLAPDDSTAENNLLASFFDGVSQGQEDSTIGGVVDGVCGIWGRLLVSYGSVYAKVADVADVADDAFDSVEGGSGGPLAAWIRKRLAQAVEDAGFEPCDMRLRKPVLTNSQDVLDHAGLDGVGKAREFVDALPGGGSPGELAAALGQDVSDELGGSTVTIAELPIPGTDLTIPLTIDLAELARAS